MIAAGEGAALAPPAVRVQPLADGRFEWTSPLPLPDHPDSVIDWLDRAALEHPDRPALADWDERAGDWRDVPYGALARLTRLVAADLLARGLGPGQGAVTLAPNSVALAVFILACYRLGAPVLILSPAYGAGAVGLDKAAAALQALQPRAAFLDPSLAHGSLGQALTRLAIPDLLLGPDSIGLDLDPASSAGASFEGPPVDPDAPAKILLSSGSTGQPKAVINTQRMMTSNITSLLTLWPFARRRPPALVDWLPWSHTFGGNQNMHLCLATGGVLRIDPGRPTGTDMQRSLAALARTPPSILFNIPSGWRALLDAVEGDPTVSDSLLSALDLAFFAGAALPDILHARLRRWLDRASDRHIPIVTGWGQTETGPMITTLHFPSDDPRAIGLPGPGTRLRLEPVQNGFHALVKGPGVTPGYLGDDAATAGAFDADGWFATGDLVVPLDPERPEAGLSYRGRLSENFKLETGTWVTVSALRQAVLAALPANIVDAVPTGEGQAGPGLLLLAEPPDSLDPASVAPALHRYNAGAPGSAARIVVAAPLTPRPDPQAQEINEKGVINQHLVRQRRAELIARLHAGDLMAAIHPVGPPIPRVVHGAGLRIGLRLTVPDPAPAGRAKIPVVMLHASATGAATLDRLALRLAASGHAVAALDQFGYGDSALDDPDRLDLTEVTRAVSLAMDTLEWPRAALFGHSMGGLGAVASALAMPDRTAALIAAEPMLFDLIGPESGPAAEADKERSQGWFADGLAPDATALADFITHWGGRPWASLDEGLRARLRALAPHLGREGRMVASARLDRSRLAGLDLPMLLLAGQQTRPGALAMLDALGTLCPHARQLRLPGAGHMLAITHVAEVAAAILELLGRLDAGNQGTGTSPAA